MRNKQIKHVLALTLATTLSLGMGINAFAITGDQTGNGSGSGDGDFEGHVDKEVVSVELPTVATGDSSVFNYKMDPEGLIAATNNAAHSGASFESGKNVFFQSAANTWTAESAKLKVVNKGTVDVDVKVSASTAANTDIAMAENATGFTETNKNAELYLGLLVANQNAVAVKEAPNSGDPDATVSVGLKGNEENYEVAHSNNTYSYAVKSGVPDTAWNSFEIGLTGACNPYGDYSTENLAASKVTVTWAYSVREENSSATLLSPNAVSDAAPSVTTTDFAIMEADTPATINVGLGAGSLKATGVASVIWAGDGANHLGNDVSYADGVVTIGEGAINYFLSAPDASTTYTIIFDDDESTEVQVTLEAKSA